jgi:hypothetical protein
VRIRLVDVSVTGGGIIAPPGVAEGALMHIRRDGAEGIVAVQRVTPVEAGAETLYGVTFVSLEPRLQEELFGLVGDRKRPDRPSADGF